MSALSRQVAGARYANTDTLVFAAVSAPLEAGVGTVGLIEDKATLSNAHNPTVTIDANGFVTNLIREGSPQTRIDITNLHTNWVSVTHRNNGDLFAVVDLTGRSITVAPGTYRFTIFVRGIFAIYQGGHLQLDGAIAHWITSANQLTESQSYSVNSEFFFTVSSTTVVTLPFNIAGAAGGYLQVTRL